MWKLFFTKLAIKSLKKLDKAIQKRIKTKLEFYISQENPLVFARKLIDSSLWEYRFRVWEYRIIFDVDENWKIIIIAVIWHRKNIYK